MKRTLSLLLSIILLLSLVTACVKTEKTLSVAGLLDLGEKYLLEMNYEQAVIQFLKVIEIEPMNARGYTGAAEAYIGLEQVDEAVAVLHKGFEQTQDDEIRNILDVLTQNYIKDSNENINEIGKNTREFTPGEIVTMEEVCQGIIREDYELLFDLLSKSEFDELFSIDPINKDVIKEFIWLSEHGDVKFRKAHWKEGDEAKGKTRETHEMYSVRFGDIENGIMYHLHWGESYGTDLGVAVIIQTIAHKNGLSNGQYSIYSYRPNNISYDIILVHETGMAVSGMKSGIENVVQTYIDGSSNTTERYYENGVFDYAKSGYSKTDDSFIHYIGRYYNKETNEYELMNMW